MKHRELPLIFKLDIHLILYILYTTPIFGWYGAGG